MNRVDTVELRELHAEFLARWPIHELPDISIAKYVDIGNPDTFCQWVETKTKPLGSIQGADFSHQCAGLI